MPAPNGNDAQKYRGIPLRDTKLQASFLKAVVVILGVRAETPGNDQDWTDHRDRLRDPLPGRGGTGNAPGIRTGNDRMAAVGNPDTDRRTITRPMVQQEGLADATGARRWREGVETVRSICELWDRGVKVRALAEAEAQWTRYLEADEGSPETFFGQVLVMFSAWVADQEMESIKRRTRDGLERARQQGKALGPPRKVGPGQLAAMRRMREGGSQPP